MQIVKWALKAIHDFVLDVKNEIGVLIVVAYLAETGLEFAAISVLRGASCGPPFCFCTCYAVHRAGRLLEKSYKVFLRTTKGAQKRRQRKS